MGLGGGIGLTMSLFIAGLALPAGATLETAKLATLTESCAAANRVARGGDVVLKPGLAPGAAATADEAERSTR